MTDIDSLLDDRMTAGTGDYPPWFDEEPEEHDQGEPPLQEEGDRLQGRITTIRDDPFYDPDEEDEPKPILHVRTDDGVEWSTRTHTILVDLIRQQEPEVGDFIRIEYLGAIKTDRGQMANNYKIGVVREEELQDVDTSSNSASTETSEEEPETTEEPEEPDTTEESEEEDSSLAINPADYNVSNVQSLVETIEDRDDLEAILEAEREGKDRKTAKGAIQERINEIAGDEGTEEPEETEDEEDAEIPGDVIEFAESLLSFHGSLTLAELDEYLHDTRDFDVEVEAVVEALDAELDGDTVVAE